MVADVRYGSLSRQEEQAVRSAWEAKRHPEHQPVRFLAGVWEQRTGTPLTPKQMGQLRDLRKALGDFTREVIEWMVDSVH